MLPFQDGLHPMGLTVIVKSTLQSTEGSVLMTPMLRVCWPDADIHMDRLSEQKLTGKIFRLNKTDVGENKGLLPSIRVHSICKDPKMLAILSTMDSVAWLMRLNK